MLKIRIDAGDGIGEWLHAERLGRDRAAIRNIPCFVDEPSLGDVVEFGELDEEFGGPHPTMKALSRIISRVTRPFSISYSDCPGGRGATNCDCRHRLEAIVNALSDVVWPIEGAHHGVATVAVPIDTPFSEAMSRLEALPFVVQVEPPAID
jgi:hypothetical protein